jgi:arylsulfatase A-like enzyme
MTRPRMSRRQMLRATALGSMSLMTVRRAWPQTQRRPNIVFILADDMGYADVACYGRPDLRTPNIDRLAASGVRLLQAYANSAVCTATRVGLITGRYQYRLRIGLEEPLAIAVPDVGLPPEHPTLPSLLRKAGYGTTLVGKWHLGYLPKFGPLQSGYDHFFGFRSGAIDYYSHNGTDQKPDLWDGDVPVQQSGYMTNLLGDRAVSAINVYAKARQPFLLSVHFNAPHWPWEAPGDEAESERIRATNLFHYDGGTQKTYQRMITELDTQVGRVLDALKSNGLTDNTIVVFTSDNGGERFADTWPFSGRQTELLEGGLRIPAIVSWPAGLPKNKTSEQVAISMDWLPTLLAAAGARPDDAFPPDGINLLPVLKESTAPVRRTLFWRYKSNAQRAIRDGDLKYLKLQDNTFLFNVVDDPMERANLKERQKDAYERLAKQWLAWNATMLPEVPESNTGGNNANTWADHIGLRSTTTPDNPAANDTSR